jgi:hypothetical protein
VRCGIAALPDMSHAARDRFRDFVVLHMASGRLLSAAQERELIGDGIARFELAGEVARGVVATAADGAGRIREDDVSRSMLAVLRALGGRRGRIDKRRFLLGVTLLRAMTDGQVGDAEARIWLKRLVEQQGLRVRGSFLLRRKRWFRKIRATPA